MTDVDPRKGRQPQAAGPSASPDSEGPQTPGLVGIVLAAGAGRRMGQPKALVADDAGPWLERAARHLLKAGCRRVLAVLGASAADAARLLPDDPRVSAVVAPEWTEGVGASLRAGLEAAATVTDDAGNPPSAALVTLVDLPWIEAEAFARVAGAGAAPTELRRAVYAGRPGHPVLIGREHWAPLRVSLAGDTGAGPYLAAHGALGVDCSGLGGDRDQDEPLGGDRGLH